MNDRDIDSVEEKLRKMRRLEAMGEQLDEMIKALDEIAFSIDNVLENDRCPVCQRYTLRPDAGSDKTTLRCGRCKFTIEVPEEML